MMMKKKIMIKMGRYMGRFIRAAVIEIHISTPIDQSDWCIQIIRVDIIGRSSKTQDINQ